MTDDIAAANSVEFGADPGQLANALMDRLVSRARRQLELMRDLGDRMAEIRVSETSPDGAVTVTVDGNGALLDLVLSAAVNRLTPAEFDEAVVGTARRAAALAFARRGELVAEFNDAAGSEEEGTPGAARPNDASSKYYSRQRNILNSEQDSACES